MEEVKSDSQSSGCHLNFNAQQQTLAMLYMAAVPRLHLPSLEIKKPWMHNTSDWVGLCEESMTSILNKKDHSSHLYQIDRSLVVSFMLETFTQQGPMYRVGGSQHEVL